MDSVKYLLDIYHQVKDKKLWRSEKPDGEYRSIGRWKTVAGRARLGKVLGRAVRARLDLVPTQERSGSGIAPEEASVPAQIASRRGNDVQSPVEIRAQAAHLLLPGGDEKTQGRGHGRWGDDGELDSPASAGAEDPPYPRVGRQPPGDHFQDRGGVRSTLPGVVAAAPKGRVRTSAFPPRLPGAQTFPSASAAVAVLSVVVHARWGLHVQQATAIGKQYKRDRPQILPADAPTRRGDRRWGGFCGAS